MELIAQLLLAGFETFLIIYFMDHVLDKNDERKKARILAFTCYFIFQCITYIIDFPFFSTSYIYILFSLLIALSFYYNEKRIKLIASSLFVTLNYASKLLSSILYTFYVQTALPANPFQYILPFSAQFLACSIVLLITLTIISTRRTNNKILKSTVNFLLFIYPLINLFAAMSVLRDIDSQSLYYDITFLLFGYSFFLFFIIDQILYSSERQHHSQVMEERLKLQNQYYNDIEQYNLEMKRYRHDFKNHLSNIAGMLSQNRKEDAINYISSINDKIDSIKSVVNSGNSVVDVVLNNKANIAHQHNITTNHEIVIPPALHLDSVDLCVILGNLYDNAIEASDKIEIERWINVQVLIYKESLFIDFKNHFDGFIKTSENHYLSSKQNSSEHGIGLSNVRHVVDKLHGTMTLTHDDYIFNVSIILPLNKTTE